MIWFILIPILFWAMIMTLLLTPSVVYSNAFDRITRAKWRKDRTGLQIMLDHLNSRPEEWSISRNGASFPKEGAKDIVLSYDGKTKQLEYVLNKFGGDFRPLTGHFAKEFDAALNRENGRRESTALLRSLYPNLDGPKLLN